MKSPAKIAIVAVPAVLLGAFAYAVYAKTGMHMPENISEFGREVDRLYTWILYITGLMFFATETLLIFAVVRYDYKEGRKADYTHGNHHLEVAWTAIPGLILFTLAVVQYGIWKDIKIAAPNEDGQNVIKVQLLAKQFNWNFRYAGQDGAFGTADDIYTIGTLHIPVDHDVLLYMRSMDVIHSFFVPSMRFKQDVVPGMQIRAWFRADTTTREARENRKDHGLLFVKKDTGRKVYFDYEIACAELCGANHHQMRGKVVIQTRADFDAWMKHEMEDVMEREQTLEDMDPIWRKWDEYLSLSDARYYGEIDGRGFYFDEHAHQSEQARRGGWKATLLKWVKLLLG